MAISRSLRFQILKRDGHTCRYCGAKAPDVKLHVDHVMPMALGGADEPGNLVTACAECNGGKAAAPPDASVVDDVAQDAIRWAKAIAQAAEDAAADDDRRLAIISKFLRWWGKFEEIWGECPLPSNWESGVMAMVNAGYPTSMLVRAMGTSMLKEHIRNADKFRYMCGIAWSQLSEIQASAKGIASGKGWRKVG